MNEELFVNQRRGNWQKLSEYCERGEVSIKTLSAKEFHDFIRLYRNCCTDLAVARTEAANPVLIDYLNGLVGRSYSTLYRTPNPGVRKAILNGLTLSAQAVRRQCRFVFLAIFLFLGMSAFVFALIRLNPNARAVFIPPGMMSENADSWVKGMPQRSPVESAQATGFYAANNPMAALMTVGLGTGTFGVGTFYDIWQNATGIGALAEVMDEHGKLGFLLASLCPHGASEISGFMIASGAGFCLGFAILCPGLDPRRVALAKAGKDAIVMACTAVIMMWVAAPFEGWFSFNPKVPTPFKVLVGAIALTAWILFFSGFGKEKQKSKP